MTEVYLYRLAWRGRCCRTDGASIEGLVADGWEIVSSVSPWGSRWCRKRIAE